jgi:hypothetical protein
VKFQIGAFIIVSALILAQNGGGKTIPQYSGDGNPDHANQPSWCQRDNADGYKANCGQCNPPSCDDRGRAIHNNNPKCGVNCRPGACRCHAACNLTGKTYINPEVSAR